MDALRIVVSDPVLLRLALRVNAPIDILIYGTKTAIKAPNTFDIAVGMFGTTAMLMGPWQERHGPRRGLLLGSIIFGVGQGNAALSLYKKSIAGVYVGYGVLGGFGLGLNYICHVSALQKYFLDSRGVASGFAMAGFGAGAVVWSKVYLPLMDQYKLPETFAILGATLSGAMLLASVFIRTPPNNFTAEGSDPGATVPTMWMYCTLTPICIKVHVRAYNPFLRLKSYQTAPIVQDALTLDVRF